eukprot:scaffold45753_cov97-Phaeocystis_antarctica.AAC.5
MAKVVAYQQLQWNRVKRELDVAQCKRGLVALEHQLEPYAREARDQTDCECGAYPKENVGRGLAVAGLFVVTLSEEHAHYDEEQREPLVRPERGLEYDDAKACRSQHLGALDHQPEGTQSLRVSNFRLHIPSRSSWSIPVGPPRAMSKKERQARSLSTSASSTTTAAGSSLLPGAVRPYRSHNIPNEFCATAVIREPRLASEVNRSPSARLSSRTYHSVADTASIARIGHAFKHDRAGPRPSGVGLPRAAAPPAMSRL